MLTQEQEAKRSKEWITVMAVSSILIILIAVFFLVRMFHSNPLEGTWLNEESDMTIQIKDNGTMIMEMPGVLDGKDMELSLNYDLDLNEKVIRVEEDADAMHKAIEKSDGEVTEEMLRNEADVLIKSFDYSVEQEELTLTEREYGDQMTFVKK